MASSSSSHSSPSMTQNCFFCTFPTVHLRRGWQLRDGGFAELCDRCGSAYEEGRFCLIFHSNADGWRDCRACGKMVHCGCIMSVHTYDVLDFGGVNCMGCSGNSTAMAPNQCPSSLWNAAPEFLRNLRDPSELELSDSDKAIAGMNYGAHSVAPLGSVVPYAFPSEIAPGAASHALAARPQLGEQFYANSPNSGNASYDICIGNEKSQGKEELLPIFKDSNSVLTKLFDKSLTASDTDPKLGRLVIPKKYAKAHFPKIHPAQGFPVDFLDTGGHNWKFHFRCWANNRSKMYVLEGLRDYMLLMDWQIGDIVTFYWMEPEGKWVIGTRKDSTVQPPPKEPTLG